ncbi:hypothetical protein E2C01_062270 [Portunus trituberculatus]|uniref:Uncharacterized protein n=1 Tax=Portunus trituberculatus TaxID=210409 RepID=A0A5B7HGU7_PORTR|nr:hypothetical protein [Portunus trituberculatus]
MSQEDPRWLGDSVPLSGSGQACDGVRIPNLVLLPTLAPCQACQDPGQGTKDIIKKCASSADSFGLWLILTRLIQPLLLAYMGVQLGRLCKTNELAAACFGFILLNLQKYTGSNIL